LSNVNKKNSTDIENIKKKFESILPDIKKILSISPNKDALINLISDDDKLKPIFMMGIETYLKEKMNNNLDLLKIYKLFYNYILDYNKENRIISLNTKLESWNLHLEKFKKGYFDSKDTIREYCKKLIKKEIPEPVKKIVVQQKNASTVSTSRKKAEQLINLDTKLSSLINNDIFIQTLNDIIEFCDSDNTSSIEDFINNKILILKIRLVDEKFLKNLVDDSLVPILKLGIDKNKKDIDIILTDKKDDETIFINQESI